MVALPRDGRKLTPRWLPWWRRNLPAGWGPSNRPNRSPWTLTDWDTWVSMRNFLRANPDLLAYPSTVDGQEIAKHDLLY